MISIYSFPIQGKNQLLTNFNECISNGNPKFIAQYQKFQQSWPLVFTLIMLVGMVLCAVLYIVGDIHVGYGIPVTITIVSGVVGIVATCILKAKTQVAARKWREDILDKVQSKMSIWAEMYPAFTFTIIYPVKEWRGNGKNRRRLIGIWCYIRVTQGPCHTGMDI